MRQLLTLALAFLLQTNGGTGPLMPPTCTMGSIFVQTAWGRIYLCTATDTWSLQSTSLLGSLKSADFNTTADQPIAMTAAKYVVRKILIVNASTSLSVAVGGLYTDASKGGTPIVAATQSYAGLTGSTKFLDLTLAAILATDVRTEGTLYFSLTIAQGSAATADIYLIGDVLP
jgi:hypothetical protein